jgi:hypothetical protein
MVLDDTDRWRYGPDAHDRKSRVNGSGRYDKTKLTAVCRTFHLLRGSSCATMVELVASKRQKERWGLAEQSTALDTLNWAKKEDDLPMSE